MNTEAKTSIFYITDSGLSLAKKISGLYNNAQIYQYNSRIVPEVWNESKVLIFIMAAGIVVRTIAPLVKDKRLDPAVIVIDDNGQFSVSLLSGHLGKANAFATEIADFLGSRAVITTASDSNNLPSLDLWAIDNDLVIEDWGMLPKIMTRFLNSGVLKIYIEHGHEGQRTWLDIKLPDEFSRTDNPELADVLITNKTDLTTDNSGKLYLRPRNIVLGIGCNTGTPADEIEAAVKKTLREHNLSFLSVASIATIDLKENERGLIGFAKNHDFKINFYSPDELNTVPDIKISEHAYKATGAYAVAEPSALLASGNRSLLISKQKIGNVTVSAAEMKKAEQLTREAMINKNDTIPHSETSDLPCGRSAAKKMGRIYIVGTGPGSIEHITPAARNAISQSDVIVGYGTYLELVRELIRNKEVISTGMTQEIDRCKTAIRIARDGKTVSVISGGDPGIYAMAGLVFELLSAETQQKGIASGQQIRERNKDISYSLADELSRSFATSLPDVEVIPGISALNACAARLGAPLMHDFASISLSDRLTPWELIEKRLHAASMSDFVIAIYNPRSMGRPEHINKARDIILQYRKPETPVGIVKAAMRENEKIIVTNLEEMLRHEIDMQSTLIIGNSQTFLWESYMITPRGYTSKYEDWRRG